TCCPLQRHHARVATDHNDVWCECNQFRRRFANAFGISGAPAVFDAHVAAIGPTQFLQPLQERSDTGKRFRIVRGPGQQHPDAPHRLAPLLPPRRAPPPPPPPPPAPAPPPSSVMNSRRLN